MPEPKSTQQSMRPWGSAPLVPGTAVSLVFHKNGSAWEKVSVGDEWVAQIHHERGARDWDIHFRENIPFETYKTRKAAVAALKARFTPDATGDDA